MPIVVSKEVPELRLGVVGSVLVNVWYSQATIPSLRLLLDEQAALTAARGPMTVISIALSIPKAPSKEAAEWLKQNEANNPMQVRGTIIAIITRGLGAVFVRSFIAAISLFSKTSYIVVKDLESAAKAARELPGQSPEIVAMDSLAADLAAFAALPPPA